MRQNNKCKSNGSGPYKLALGTQIGPLLQVLLITAQGTRYGKQRCSECQIGVHLLVPVWWQPFDYMGFSPIY